MPTKYRSIFITDYVLDLDFYRNCDKWDVVPEYICVGGVEETKLEKKHYHVTIYYTNPRSKESILEFFKPRHIEPCRSWKACINYSIKTSETVFEYGLPPNQGARNDLLPLKKYIQDGHTLRDIAESFPELFLKYHNGIEKMVMLYATKNVTDWVKPEIIVTTTELFDRTSKMKFDNTYVKSEGRFWDGYHQQDIVIYPAHGGLEEQLLSAGILQRVEIKHGSVEFKSKIVYLVKSADFGFMRTA